jgi:hypothetical protein
MRNHQRCRPIVTIRQLSFSLLLLSIIRARTRAINRRPVRRVRRSFSLSLLCSLLILLSVLACWPSVTQRLRSTFVAERVRPAALPNLQGGAATTYLQEQGLYSSLAEAMAAARYKVQALPTANTFQLSNPAQAFRAIFSADGMRVITKKGAKERETVFKLTGYGYGARLSKLSAPNLVAHENRIEYEWSVAGESETRNLQSAIKEWYVNQPDGLEQGFTLSVPPPVESQGEPLRVVLALRGDLRAELAADGQSISLADGHNQNLLSYSELKAWDAHGMRLAARMRVEGSAIALEMDEAGATYPITIDPLIAQQAKLTASDGAAGDNFGKSVAISGDTVVIGAPGDDVLATNQGSAYVFVRSGTSWSQQQKLTASDGAVGDWFGNAVALSGDTAVIGAFGDDIGSNANQGSAYVFVRSGTGWAQQQKLTASDGAQDDVFGISVALSGDTVMVGAPGDDFSVFSNIGTVYAFGVQSAMLTPTSASFPGNSGMGTPALTGTINVTLPADCNWTATTNDSFITITEGQSGTGNGTVSYTLEPNPSNTTRRTGTITIGSRTFTVLQGPQFFDVATNHPFYTFIGKLAARGATLGCSSGSYCPDGNVTREQMAIFIERALGVFTPPPGPQTPTFADVPNSGATDYGYEFIEDFVARGITQGCIAGPPRLYCPTANVTREQMAIFIIRALGMFTPPPGPQTPTFQDVPNSGATDYSYEFIEEFVRRGITSGCEAGPPRLYCPTAAVTRGQMAVFLVRAFNL